MSEHHIRITGAAPSCGPGREPAGLQPVAVQSAIGSMQASREPMAAELEALSGMGLEALRLHYRQLHRKTAPAHLPRWLLMRVVAYRLQALAHGDLDLKTLRYLDRVARDQQKGGREGPRGKNTPAGRSGSAGTIIAPVPTRLRPGTQLVREHGGELHRVIVLEQGFSWNGRAFTSLSEIARKITDTNWNGPAFFGLRPKRTLSRVSDGHGLSPEGGAP
jgi:hypothetical protein